MSYFFRTLGIRTRAPQDLKTSLLTTAPRWHKTQTTGGTLGSIAKKYKCHQIHQKHTFSKGFWVGEFKKRVKIELSLILFEIQAKQDTKNIENFIKLCQKLLGLPQILQQYTLPKGFWVEEFKKRVKMGLRSILFEIWSNS